MIMGGRVYKFHEFGDVFKLTFCHEDASPCQKQLPSLKRTTSLPLKIGRLTTQKEMNHRFFGAEISLLVSGRVHVFLVTFRRGKPLRNCNVKLLFIFITSKIFGADDCSPFLETVF